MAEKEIKPTIPGEKSKGTAFSSLIGFLSLLLGAYALAVHFNIFKFGFELPALTMPIALVLCGIFLLKEASHRSMLSMLKRRYERHI